MSVPLIVLFLWPVVVFVLFSKYKASAALLGSIIGGYLLLPTMTGFDLPLLPKMDKHSVPAVAVILATMMIKLQEVEPTHLSGWRTKSKIANVFLACALAGPTLTVLQNSDPLVFPELRLEGLRLYDGFSLTLATIMMMLPFILAYRYLAHPKHHRTILFALVIAGLLYSIPALYEIRMSPQLNRYIYGFFPHSFQQHMRGDGYRPLVFLQHGLRLSLFFAMSVLACIGCLRLAEASQKNRLWAAAGYMVVILVMSKSLGALSTAILLSPAVLFLRPRLQLMIGAVLACCILTYPVLRGTGFIPVDNLYNFAASIDIERAESLAIRLYNEELLLNKASQRPFLGWGGWGRWRVYDDIGNDISITDGYWVIILGEGGWMRYLAEFGLLTAPLILLALRARREEIGLETSVLALILVINIIDLIPNSAMTPVTWLIAGALWGRLALKNPGTENIATEDTGKRARKNRYSRPKASPAAHGDIAYTRQTTIKHRNP